MTDLPLLIDTSNPAARTSGILVKDDIFSWGMVSGERDPDHAAIVNYDKGVAHRVS